MARRTSNKHKGFTAFYSAQRTNLLKTCLVQKERSGACVVFPPPISTPRVWGTTMKGMCYAPCMILLHWTICQQDSWKTGRMHNTHLWVDAEACCFDGGRYLDRYSRVEGARIAIGPNYQAARRCARRFRFFFNALDSHFQQVRLLQAALKKSREQFLEATKIPQQIATSEQANLKTIITFVSTHYPAQLRAAADQVHSDADVGAVLSLAPTVGAPSPRRVSPRSAAPVKPAKNARASGAAYAPNSKKATRDNSDSEFESPKRAWEHRTKGICPGIVH
jgi:hypothetical protein